MIQYTVVLESRRFPIPESGILELVKHLIERGKTKIDYFGLEIDNPADFADEEMERKNEETTFINISFESEVEIDIENLSEQIQINYILDILNTQPVVELQRDQKDISIIL